MGIVPDKGLSAHVFMLLDQEVSAQELKNYLVYLNLNTPLLRERIYLQASGMGLHWPLDITVAQNDKLIYVAPPFLGEGVVDNLVPPRLQHVERAHSKLVVPSIVSVEAERLALLDELRLKAGLPLRKWTTRQTFGEEVLSDPDPIKEWEIADVARGFVYLNLNGGNSRAYYHPIDDPNILFNFKGEPNYSLRELLPDYYPQAVARAEQAAREAVETRKTARQALKAEVQAEREAQAKAKADAKAERKAQAEVEAKAKADARAERKAEREAEQEARVKAKADAQAEQLDLTRDTYEDVLPHGLRFLLMADRVTGLYYRGSYNFDTGELDVHPTRMRQQLIDFSLEKNNFRPAYIPTWDVVYDFNSLDRIDVAARRINLFEPTQYMLDQASFQSGPTPIVDRILDSISGSCPTTRAHLFNWLAFIWQRRTKTKTAWILHGTTGTGKGLLYNQIMKPLFGALAQQRTLDALEDQYNGYMRNCLILFLDESDTDKVKNLQKLVAKAKNWVTEPTLSVREMYVGQIEAANHLNLLFASNRHNPMQIDKNDRRFNVAPRQETRLVLSDDEFAAIAGELPSFVAKLRDHKVDERAASTALFNEAKQTVQDVTTDAPQDVVDALKEGNLRFFVDLLPGPDLMPGQDPVAAGFKELIARCIREPISTLQRGDLQIIFRYAVGWEHTTAHKFGKAVSRYGLKLMPNWIDGAPVRSVRVSWNVDEETQKLGERLMAPTPLRAVK
jgi:hypothetical protein